MQEEKPPPTLGIGHSIRGNYGSSFMRVPDAYRAKQSSARPPMCRSFHAILRHGSR